MTKNEYKLAIKNSKKKEKEYTDEDVRIRILDIRYYRKKRLIFVCSLLLLLAPVIIYNALNFSSFYKVDALRITIAGLIAISVICIALMVKFKQKLSIFFILTGGLLILLNEIALQLGVSLILIAAGRLTDTLVLSTIKQRLEEKWCNDTNRQYARVKPAE